MLLYFSIHFSFVNCNLDFCFFTLFFANFRLNQFIRKYNRQKQMNIQYKRQEYTIYNLKLIVILVCSPFQLQIIKDCCLKWRNIATTLF